MPIKRTVAILLNADGKSVSPQDVAKASGITTGQASTELSRTVKMGIAKKIGRGEYVIFNVQWGVDFLNKQTQHDNTNHVIGDNVAPAKTEIFVRPHRLWFKAKVNNVPIIKGAIKCGVSRRGAWRCWNPNQSLTMYEKLIDIPTGTATVRYAEGRNKRTIRVTCDDVLVKGDQLSDHLVAINRHIEAALRHLCNEDGFNIGLILMECDHHYGVPLPVQNGWQLPPPGHIPLNSFWWMDSSHGWPEVETTLVQQAKKLVELPGKVDALPSAIKELVKEAVKEALEANRLQYPHTEPEGGYA